jgi:threonine synthase
MKYVSTCGGAAPANLSETIATGLAPDGGLWVPSSIPTIDISDLEERSDLPSIAERVLAPFFAGDPLEAELPTIAREAFDFPLPLHSLATPHDHVVELFHGPTAAFKDFGARFLAASLARIRRGESRPLTILVATSGDTGAAVAAAFHRREGFRVVVLYPDGRVSPRQAHQLGCFGDNVTALRVAGSFDDCQRLVKSALSDRELQSRVPLSSANSISLGRLLPQIAYYAAAATRFARTHTAPLNLVIPTGNLGNALAAIFAREMKLPIGKIVLATNANDVLPRFFAGEEFRAKESVATIANAMDVGAPSNFERLRWLFPDGELRRAFEAQSVSDEEIRGTIRTRFERYGETFCPHTATALHVLGRLRARGEEGEWAIVATAHPAKFEGVVEPLTRKAIDVPSSLAELLRRKSSAIPLAADDDAFKRFLLAM